MLCLLLPLMLSAFTGDLHPNSDATPLASHRNVWGASGLERIDTPLRLAPNTLSLTLVGRYGRASNFLLAGDNAQMLSQEAHILWTPLTTLDIGLSLFGVNVADAALPGQSAQSIGAPTLRFKWHGFENATWAAGALLQVAAPSASVGLLPADAAWTLLALGAWTPRSEWTVAANVGFIYDRGGDATSTPQSVAQRFASRLNLASRMAFGFGASWQRPSKLGVWRPFLEASAEVATSSVGGAAPVWLTGGLQWQPPRLAQVLLTGGVDARLSGAPSEHSAYAGLLPWTIYGRLTLTTRPEPEPEALSAPIPAAAASVCSSACPSLNAAQQAELNAPQVALRGHFTNKKGETLHAPSITIDKMGRVNLQFDPRSGEFKSDAFACQPNERFKVSVAMPGFTEETHIVSCEQMLRDPNALLVMTYAQKPLPSAIHCIALDARTSEPIQGATMLVEGLSWRPVQTDSDGAVTLHDVKPGTYRIIIRAPKFRPQRRTVQLGVGTTVILNIDLRPQDVASPKPAAH